MDQLKKESVAIDIFNAVKQLNIFGKSDESFVHRFAYKYTAFVFVICLLMHGYTIIVKDKDKDHTGIYCIYPNEISTDEAKLFSKLYCWSSNTYYVPTDSTLPQKGEARNYKITYYQWVPWILIICSVLATTPFKTWHYLTKSYYFDLEHIMTLVDKAKKERVEQEKFKTTQKNIIDLVKKSMEDYHNSRQNLNPYRRWLTSYYLIISYTITRVLYLITSFSLFWLLNILLGQNYYGLYGFKVLKDIFKGKDHAVESSFFPRITMCDVPIRSTGHNINWYVVQCVLPVNFFNEKIFLILWFWNAFILIGTVISTVLWFKTNFCSNEAFVKSYLRLNRKLKTDSKVFKSFMSQYLTHDVIFMLHVIEKKGTHRIINETIYSLWNEYKLLCKSSSVNEEENLTA